MTITLDPTAGPALAKSSKRQRGTNHRSHSPQHPPASVSMSNILVVQDIDT